MLKYKVVFMGTPAFAVPLLEALHEKHQVVAVYTQPDREQGRGLEKQFSEVKKKALELGLIVEQPERILGKHALLSVSEAQKSNALIAFEKLQSYEPDLLVVCAYGQILRQPVLDLPKLGALNLHSSILPRWRGAAPIHWTLLSGDRFAGVSTMKMVLACDAGPVYQSASIEVAEDETYEQLHDRLKVLGASLMIETLDQLPYLEPKAQVEEEVTLAPKIEKEMGKLDSNLTAMELSLKVRALNPWPSTWIELPDRLLKVRKCKWVATKVPQGELMQVGTQILWGCKSGALELLKVQELGKKELDALVWWSGARLRK